MNNKSRNYTFFNTPIYVKTDPAGNIKPDKEKSTERIDGAVALIMALDRALRNENKVSVYDERGILIL
jgi:phage terminase large subunit-like protein